MATPNQKSSGKTIAGLRVIAKTEGFRRAGRAWSAAATEVPASEFDKTQLAQLRGDPSLMVADIEIPVADAPAETDK